MNILTENCLPITFSQYTKCRIQRLEEILDNLDNNSAQNISVSRYKKDKQNYIEQIKSLENKTSKYIRQIKVYETEKNTYIKRLKDLNKEVKSLKSSACEIENECYNLEKKEHETNKKNLKQQVNNLEQENKSCWSTMKRMEQKNETNLLNKIKEIETKIESRTLLLSQEIKNIQLLLDKNNHYLINETKNEIHDLKKLIHNELSEALTNEIHELIMTLQNSHNDIRSILPNNNTPFYAEISELWAVINGIVYFFGRTNKKVKVIYSLSTVYEERLPRRCDVLLDLKYKKLEYLINSLNLLDKKNFIYNWQELKEEQELD
ncbi:211_t:CDS:2 [Gigaspora margarita]|uniref:211_t:CDS:1 n=1 Tax=Gigaspora margarita TaxID=4874 RepID=A0ABN7UAC1_GIGMA|nr:211_t:CDS:2 [Gigaspora margarita]